MQPKVDEYYQYGKYGQNGPLRRTPFGCGRFADRFLTEASVELSRPGRSDQGGSAGSQTEAGKFVPIGCHKVKRADHWPALPFYSMDDDPPCFNS